MGSDSYVLLVTIVERKLKDKIIKALSDLGGVMFNMTYAKGTAKEGELLASLGLAPERKKVLITCFLQKANVENVLTHLINEYAFDKPNTGIAFSVPLSKVIY